LIVGGRTRFAAVLGHPVEHSRSPALHNAAYRALGIDAVYVALDVAPQRLVAALDGVVALGMLGVNVTVPHKAAALAWCEEIDDVARLVGAVNTVVVDAGVRRGWNTDVHGYRRSLEEMLPRPPEHAVVLGAGGAARAVVVALGQLGAATRVIARDPERGRVLLGLGANDVAPWTAAALERALANADLVVDTTTLGLSAESEQAIPAPVPLAALPAHAVVSSLVYHREPALLAAARARGLRVLDGSGMLVHQAARAFTLMTGREAPLEVMRAALPR
jgi:shikimate dehydrogenase